jgi:hypothetical protein
MLHILIEPKTCQAINLMRFAQLRVRSPNKKLPMFSIGLFQLVGAIVTELIILRIICQETDPSNIVINLIAFAVIAEIDDLYGSSLKNNIAQGLIQENVTLNFDRVSHDGRDLLDGVICRWFFKFIQMLYDAIYFYFWPHLSIVYSFILA